MLQQVKTQGDGKCHTHNLMHHAKHKANNGSANWQDWWRCHDVRLNSKNTPRRYVRGTCSCWWISNAQKAGTETTETPTANPHQHRQSQAPSEPEHLRANVFCLHLTSGVNAVLDRVDPYTSEHGSLSKDLRCSSLKAEDRNQAFQRCCCSCAPVLRPTVNGERFSFRINTKDSQHLLMYLFTQDGVFPGKSLSLIPRLLQTHGDLSLLRTSLPHAPHAAHCFVPKAVIFCSRPAW